MTAIVQKIKSSNLLNKGTRLDASFYGGPDQKELQLYLSNSTEKRELRELTKNGENGIFIPARFKRNYVANIEYGYPYLTGSIIVQDNPFNNCRFLSRKYTRNIERLKLYPNMITVTCSGRIGETVFISEFFDGAIGSPDLLRIIPDPNKIFPGYLYAFLSSNIGKQLIIQNTYGSVVPHIEAHHLYDLLVPVVDEAIMKEIDANIRKAIDLKVESAMINGKTLNDLQSRIV